MTFKVKTGAKLFGVIRFDLIDTTFEGKIEQLKCCRTHTEEKQSVDTKTLTLYIALSK